MICQESNRDTTFMAGNRENESEIPQNIVFNTPPNWPLVNSKRLTQLTNTRTKTTLILISLVPRHKQHKKTTIRTRAIRNRKKFFSFKKCKNQKKKLFSTVQRNLHKQINLYWVWKSSNNNRENVSRTNFLGTFRVSPDQLIL